MRKADESWNVLNTRRDRGAAFCLALVLGALFALVSPQLVSAQAVYGSIYGTITDSSGAVVPTATITVTDIAKGTSFNVQTDANGNYRAEHLIPDTYSVSAEAKGFQKVTTPNVVVYADTSPKVDLTLTLGSVNTVATVTSAAPLLQTQHTDVNTILNERAVETLPNLNRNFTAFELLTPGTTYIGWNVDESQNPQRSQQIEVDGQLPFATGYELDGTDNQDPVIGIAVINPNLDAVSEMKVTSQNYDAEFGKAVAGLVTAQTKSGTNNFHGSLFEYRRTDALQARDPFAQQTPDPVTGRFIPATHHNQFGGSLGGPIIKDKLFFFADYQGLREVSGVSGIFSIPTAKARSTCLAAVGNASLKCDLSDYLVVGQIYNPATGDISGNGRTPFAGNLIPGNLLSVPAVALLNDMPAPNTGAVGQTFNNYAVSGSGTFHTNQWDVRIDNQISERFHIFGRYTMFNSTLDGGSVFGAAGGSGFGTNGFAGHDTSLDQSLATGGDYTLSQSWLTDFRFGWFRFHFNELQPDYNQPLGANLGIPGVNTGDLNLNGGLPAFDINGLSAFGVTTAPFIETENQFQGTNNWSHIIGRHNIKFGVDIRYGLQFAVGLDNNNFRSGNFHFPNSITGSNDQGSPGVGLATFLLGDVGPFQRTQTADTNTVTHQWRMFYYGQDVWRITDNLTLNYGLRWEWYFPEAVNAKGAGGLLNLDTGNVAIAGYGPYNLSMNVRKSWDNFAPRIGVSWQFRPKTVFRAGYGRVYGQGWSGDTFGEVLGWTYPVQVSQNLNPVTEWQPSFLLSNGPPAYTFAPIPANGQFPLPDGIGVPTRPQWMRLPTLDAWNVAIQHELPWNSTIQVAYVGSHGINNMFDSSNQFDPNQATIAGFNQINPATGLPYTYNDRQPYFNGIAQTLGVTYGHPFGWTQSLRYNANEANSSYNALQIKYQKQFGHGFQLLSHYTWSKALTHESYYFAIDPSIGYGPSYYNRPKAFVAAGSWDLPVGKGKTFLGGAPSWVNYVVGGYSLDSTVTIQSGLPYTPTYSLCGNDNDLGLCFPNYTGQSYHLGAGSYDPVTNSVRYFAATTCPLGGTDPNTGAPCPSNFGPYARPAVGTFGNIRRDSLNGPGLWNVDLAAAKKFPLTEGVNLQFRAEFFNLFNHVNLGEPNNCVDCVGGGLIQSTISTQDGTSMRRVQFAVRLDF